MTPLTIYVNHDFPPDQHAELERVAAPQRVVWARARNNSNLVAAGLDPAALEADILYGQPSVEDAVRSERVKWVQLTSAGYTRYDKPEVLERFKARGVAFCNASSVYEEPCAQHVVAMILSVARALPSAFDRQQKQDWDYIPLRDQSFLLGGQNVVIAGYGTIARRVVELLAPFKLNVTAFRRKPKGDENCRTLPIDQIDAHLPTANVVVNILPASPSTENFFDRRRLALLNASALYVSIGRGSTTDQDALADQLTAGQLGSAYLDVATPEPLPAGHRLWTTPRLHLTPHTAGGTFDEPKRMLAHFIEQLRRFNAGEPLGDRVV